MTGAHQPLVSIKDICFSYGGGRVLDNVGLQIDQGDYLAIIGPNGGGKTTLLKIILGLLEPDSGSVTWHDRHAKRHIGYVPQFASFERSFPLCVSEVVMMGRLKSGRLFQRRTADDEHQVADILERLGLMQIADKPVGDLSGGQLQRVLIARALVTNPDILFLDEPIASIDQDSRYALTEILKELNKRIPIIIVTHDITAFASDVMHIACVNTQLYFHGDGELDSEVMEEAYGCPVELVAHGVPHRVLKQHDHS
jgi:zinc transport system ATP-binding protein